MANTIGSRQTELGLNFYAYTFVIILYIFCYAVNTNLFIIALQLGTLFSPEQALNIGLIDQVAPDLVGATEAAQLQLKSFVKIPGMHRY